MTATAYAPDPSRQVDNANLDMITSNQRVRAYRSGTAIGNVASAAPTGTQGVLWMQGTGIVTSIASSAGGSTLTSTNLGGGIIIHQCTAAVTDTTDTAANIYAYMTQNSAGIQIGDILECVVANTGAGTLTISGGATVSLDANGTGVIPPNSSKNLMFRCTATATPGFILYM